MLLQRHKITNPALADFSTINQSDIVSAASSVTGTLTNLLAAVAGISLVVGGIGIMNMMLTTVTERTREIGLSKSCRRRKKKDITTQFLVEAISLTVIGGATGVVLGWAIAFGVSGDWPASRDRQHFFGGPCVRRFGPYRHCVRILSGPQSLESQPDSGPSGIE